MTSLMSKLTGLSASGALLIAGLAAVPLNSTPASAADVEIGPGGVDVDAGDDRHHHDHYDEADDHHHHHDDYDHDRSDYHRDRDRDRDGVNIRVPGANINVD